MSAKRVREHQRGRTKFFCRYLNISRQGYYRHTERFKEVDVLISSIVPYCQEIRKDLLPRSGLRQLYACCLKHFGAKMVIGRDQCYNVLRANGFALRRKNFRPRTTNSNHNFYIYSDLLNVTPKLRPSGNGELVVTDITYVATNKGWAYLSLATDAFSRAIIGYAIRPTLDTSGPMKALHMAYDFYKKNGIDTGRLIHHSDRGIQYCSNQYVNDLKEHGVRISMTQCGDPLHNALAERMNNTIKNGWLFGSEDESIDVVAKKIEHAVNAYNNFRPHQALNMHTPMEVVNGSYLLSAS